MRHQVTDRNSVKLGPRRDLVKELFDASRRYAPELHRGLYFSMPEWFNPDIPWMGHAPRNPYTGTPVPYTGYTRGHATTCRTSRRRRCCELIHGYDPEVIWCDIGGANDSRHVLAEYFNHAKNRRTPRRHRQRPFGPPDFHDFTTPEYASSTTPSSPSGKPAAASTRSATATTRPPRTTPT